MIVRSKNEDNSENDFDSKQFRHRTIKNEAILNNVYNDYDHEQSDSSNHVDSKHQSIISSPIAHTANNSIEELHDNPITRQLKSISTPEYKIHGIQIHDSNKKSPPQHIVPILLGLMPYIMGSIFGKSDTWMELSLFMLILSWLYLSLKVPWDIYFTIKRKHSESQGATRVFYTILETILICLILSSSFIAVSGIGYLQSYYGSSQTIKFVSGFNVHLFIMATFIPTVKYFLDSTQLSENSTTIQPPQWARQIVTRLNRLERTNLNGNETDIRQSSLSDLKSLQSKSQLDSPVSHRQSQLVSTLWPASIRHDINSLHQSEPKRHFSLFWTVIVMLTWPYWILHWAVIKLKHLIRSIFKGM